jgi:putative endonuclease
MEKAHGGCRKTSIDLVGLDPRAQRPFAERVPYYVYILASRRNGTLYIGMTNDLVRRTWEHKQGVVDGFTKAYGVHRLVYFETTDDVALAQQRERTMKHWKRAWKAALIEKENPDWTDLYEGIVT